MIDECFEGSKNNMFNKESENSGLLKKIEKAYKIYKISEVFLKDVNDDYGKLKIARLRLDFARHELMTLLNEARNRGVKLGDNEVVKKFFYPSS
ncbi:MAG: hypothetical protein N3B21_06900 [Clostridia bacterium]|nr:hypothetical protein [Clostridia bacterium]